MKAYQLEPLRQREDDKANRFGLVGLSVKDRAYVAKGREERHPAPHEDGAKLGFRVPQGAGHHDAIDNTPDRG